MMCFKLFRRRAAGFFLTAALLCSLHPAEFSAVAVPSARVNPAFSQEAITPPLVNLVASRARAKVFTFHAVLLLAVLTIPAGWSQTSTAARDAVVEQGLVSAQLALRHMEVDHWGATYKNEAQAAAFLRARIATRDFSPEHFPQTAAVDDPPKNTILLNPDLFPKRSAEERAAILAHESFHGTRVQRIRVRFMMWWDSLHLSPRTVAMTPAYHRAFKQNLAVLVRNEYEALSFDLQYRVGLARAQGYVDMRTYFIDLANLPDDPEAPLHRRLAEFLAAWDLRKPATIRFKEDELLIGLLLGRFAPRFDTRVLSDIAAFEKARQGNEGVSLQWMLSWLKDPAYYNPKIPTNFLGVTPPPVRPPAGSAHFSDPHRRRAAA